jgi:4-hydroxybenzoate polyprenyltransferase
MNFSAIFHSGVVLLALSAASMALFFSILFFGVLSLTYFLVIFLLTYAVYGMDRLASLEEDRLSHPERTHFLQPNRWPFAISIVLAFSGSLLLAAASGWVAALIPLAPIAVIFYSGNLSQKVFGTRRPNLKQYFIIKDIAIASGWAFLLLVTSFYLDRPMGIGQWLFLVPLLMKLFVMAVVYDFKDINSDRRAGVRTLPVVMGEDSSKLVLHILNTVATAIILLLVYFGLLPFLGVIFIPAFIYQFFVIRLVRKDAPGWVYFIICDLEQFFWLVFLGIGGWAIGHS